MANIIRLGGGAGGSQPTLISKSITQNGTYNAVDDSADGYSSVEVNVQGGGYTPVSLVPVMQSNSQDGYIASASSEFSSQYQAYMAFDGGTTNVWAPQNNASPYWVQISMPSAKRATRFVITTRTGSYFATSVTVKGSNDGTNFTELGSVSGMGAGSTANVFNSSTSSYSIYRFVIDNFGLAEIYIEGISENIPMITSSGSQYIELPINGNGDYTYKFKVYVPATQQEKLIFGSAWNVNARLFHFMPSYLSYYINSNPTNMPYNTGILDVEASTDYIIINQIKYTGTATARSSGNIKLFGISGSSNTGVMGIGEFKVFDNSDDSLVMDLVPMEDSNTGAGYFHDTVSNTDYYSDSSTDLQYAEISV